ncbi:unnamed protein product [Scytosiphon promiscuus]
MMFLRAGRSRTFWTCRRSTLANINIWPRSAVRDTDRGVFSRAQPYGTTIEWKNEASINVLRPRRRRVRARCTIDHHILETANTIALCLPPRTRNNDSLCTSQRVDAIEN